MSCGWVGGWFLLTCISGHYTPFILAPVEGCWVGFWPITWAFSPISIQFMNDLGRPQGRYHDSFVLISLLKVCQEWGVKRGCTWRMLRVPDQRHVGEGHPWCHRWCFFTLRKIPWKLCVVIIIRNVSGIGGHERGYLENVEGSWSETWRKGSSLMSWMMFVYPKEDKLKVWCWYLY